MEGQNNDLPDLGTTESSTGKSSRQEIEKDDNNSGFQSTQSELCTEDVSRDLDVVELSSDDEVQIIDVKRKALDKNPQDEGRRSSGRTSPRDVTCSVCLSEYDNKAFLDKCFHAFCYFCILQWSEIVRTCPLCKSSFTSIIHSIKSMDNYQQKNAKAKQRESQQLHYLSKPDVHVPTSGQQSQSDERRFRYRTTLTEENRQQQQRQNQQHHRNDTDIWGQRARRRQAHIEAQRDRKAVGRERRRTIYRNNLWVQRVSQAGHPREREISPEFFRANPACTHRLIPWLTRDLRVLLNDVESYVNFVLQIILSLINKVELGSEEFSRQLQPFLFDKTEQFIHEFTSFARSPFDVTAYDERAQYSWPRESEEQLSDTPTVFHSQTSGWQTPVPGPSGESLSQTDWSRDSPVLQTENNGWSPSSAPGTSGRAGLVSTVTISSANSSASSQTTPLDGESARNDEASNAPSNCKGHKKRKSSSSETVSGETQVESEKKHQHRHYHRHSHRHKHKHKHKHRRKDSKRSEVKHEKRICRDANHLNNDLEQSTESSQSGSPPVEVIVVCSDTSASPVPSTFQNGSARNELTKFQQRKSRSRSRSQSESRSFSKGEKIVRGDRRMRTHASNSKTRSREREAEHALSDGRRSRSPLSSRKRRLKTDDQDLSQLGLSSRKSGKSRQERTRTRSRSPSHSRSDSKTPSKKHYGKFERRRTMEYSRSRSRSRSRSGSSSRRSKSRHSRSRNSRTRHLQSPSRESRSRNSQSRDSRSCNSYSRDSRGRNSRSSRSHSRPKHLPAHSSHPPRRRHRDSLSRNSPKSTANSESNSRGTLPRSNDDIKTEIEDLESRIAADKKRLLKLFMRKERTEAAQDVDGKAPRKRDEMK